MAALVAYATGEESPDSIGRGAPRKRGCPAVMVGQRKVPQKLNHPVSLGQGTGETAR